MALSTNNSVNTISKKKGLITINNFPYTINDLRNACNEDKVVWKDHATQRLLQRKILKTDAIQCILNGEIIEKYVSDKPFASCLVFGYASANLYTLYAVLTVNIPI